MAASPALARRYAEALYDVLEPDRRESALQLLRRLAEAWRQSRELRRFLTAPMVPAEVRVAALGEAAGLAVGHPVDMLLEMILQRRRVDLLPLLPEAYQQVIDERDGRQRVVVRTAVALTDAERTRIGELAQRIARGPVRLEVVVDPSVLGGVRLECGDRVVDATLRGYLQQLAEQLARAPLAARAPES